MNVGPDLLQENLLYGYDTGYSVASLGAGTRHFKGKPTTNLTTSTLTPVFSSWSGLVGTSTTYTGGYLGNSGVHVKITSGGGVNWWTSPSLAGLSGNTQYTVSATMRFTGRVFNGNDANILYIREYNSSNNQLRELGYFNSNRMLHLGGGWYRIWGTVTTQATTNRILLHGYSYDTNTDIKLQDLQFEAGSVASPFVGYNNSRADSSCLIDLTGNTDISLSNVSFDDTFTPLGNPTFDGTGDFIDVTTDFGVLNQYSFEWVENPNQTHKMPIATRTNTAFYKYGAYSWRYTHGGTAAEFYHTTGATSGWHHWVITYDGATLKIFQDNASLGTRSVTGTADFSQGLKIGWWSAGGDYDFNGDIPVMKFYNRALTTSEIDSNFKAYKNRFNI